MILIDGLIILITIKTTRSFSRKLKKIARKHYPIKLLSPCLRIIINHNKHGLLRIKDHALQGQWQGYREFHPARLGLANKQYDNWIVIYRLFKNKLILLLVTTGGHELLNR